MSRYRFELATANDDEQLRRILAQTPTEGQISLTFQREPGYFDAAVVHGGFHQTVVGRDLETGELIGLGVRSIREQFVNGVSMPIGYLSSLRLLPGHRHRGLLARGFQFFRELHADGRTPLYLTTIAAGNQPASSALTRGRAGLPNYHFAGRYFTLALRPGCLRTPICRSRIEIRPAMQNDLGSVVSFLNEHGRRRQFFPKYTSCDFLKPRSTFRDLQLADLLLAWRQDRLAGTVGVWDQTAFRQSIVHRYSRPLRYIRPYYNAWAALRAKPKLPPPGARLPLAMAAVAVVADDDPEVFRGLLAAAASHCSMQPSVA